MTTLYIDKHLSMGNTSVDLRYYATKALGTHPHGTGVVTIKTPDQLTNFIDPIADQMYGIVFVVSPSKQNGNLLRSFQIKTAKMYGDVFSLNYHHLYHDQTKWNMLLMFNKSILGEAGYSTIGLLDYEKP